MDYRSGRQEQGYGGTGRMSSGQEPAMGYRQRTQRSSQQEIAMARSMAIKKRRDEIEKLRMEKQRRTRL